MPAAAISLLVSLVVVTQQQADRRAYPPPGKLVDVGGYRLHLNCTGRNGPTVVLIAGAGDFSFDWGLVQPGVSGFTRVCSYDRAGLAWSEPGPMPRNALQANHRILRLQSLRLHLIGARHLRTCRITICLSRNRASREADR